MIVVELDKVLEVFGNVHPLDYNAIAYKSKIEKLEVYNLPTGVWVGIDEYPHEEWKCSNCGNIINTFLQDELEEHEYCHKCGAKMLMPWADTKGEEE